MRKPPLLSVLGIMAGTSAVFFLTIAMVTRDGGKRTGAFRAREARRQAVEDLPGIKPEVLRAIAEAADQAEQAGVSTMNGQPPAVKTGHPKRGDTGGGQLEEGGDHSAHLPAR